MKFDLGGFVLLGVVGGVGSTSDSQALLEKALKLCGCTLLNAISKISKYLVFQFTKGRCLVFGCHESRILHETKV